MRATAPARVCTGRVEPRTPAAMTEHRHLADGAEAAFDPGNRRLQPRVGSVSTEAAPACGPSARPAPGQRISRGPGSQGWLGWAGHGVTGEARLSEPAWPLTAGHPLAECSHQAHPFKGRGGGGGLPAGAACCLTDNLHETPQISSCKASSGWSADVRLSPPLLQNPDSTLVYTHSPGS